MAEYLRKRPLLGMALAIAGGYVLAHFSIKALDVIYDGYFERDPVQSSLAFAAIATPIALIYIYRLRLGAFITTNKWKLSIGLVLVVTATTFAAYKLAEVQEGNRFTDEVEARALKHNVVIEKYYEIYSRELKISGNPAAALDAVDRCLDEQKKPSEAQFLLGNASESTTSTTILQKIGCVVTKRPV